jgi:putative nucleotidyltransferase with HDIG domain
MAIHLLNKKPVKDYLPIYLESLRIDTVLAFDLFIKIGKEMVLYRSSNLPFTEKTLYKLLENNISHLYVPSKSRELYQTYIERNLDKILEDKKVPEEKKAGILYETSQNLMKDVLTNPDYGENINRSKDLVANTVGYILKGQTAFRNLLTISSFDYYTYTHSVNVCTFAVALAQQLGHKNEEYLNELGTGALLHDVGKSKISERIINKQTALSTVEFELMKKHPKMGVEILSQTDMINAGCYYPILQHHERGSRKGYPNKLDLNEMHEYSRIVAIVDTFDAMTTARVYQKALDTFPTLKVMFSLREGYDEKMLEAFATLMGPDGLKSI